MKECYEEAKIDPEEKISYVEAHITGTPVRIVKKIFLYRPVGRPDRLKISKTAVKPIINKPRDRTGPHVYFFISISYKQNINLYLLLFCCCPIGW